MGFFQEVQIPDVYLGQICQLLLYLDRTMWCFLGIVIWHGEVTNQHVLLFIINI